MRARRRAIRLHACARRFCGLVGGFHAIDLRTAAVVDHALENDDWLVDNRFSVTDIIMGFTISWANYYKLIEPFVNLQNYLDRLYEQPNCTLEKSNA